MRGNARLWKIARELRGRIRLARPAALAPQFRVPPFCDLLAEAIRLHDAGLGYEVAATPERRGEARWNYHPEQVRLAPSRPR